MKPNTQESLEAAEVAGLTDTQYYCEKCGRVFEYDYPEQHGCGVCNTTIGDNQVAERPKGD